MKKIPTAFVREYENHRVKNITDIYTNDLCRMAVEKGEATLKIDGSCCTIFNGEFYKRYDAKKGKKVPYGAIPCCEPDPVTGHHPHWVKVDDNNPADKWFISAYIRTFGAYIHNDPTIYTDGTYEAIGKHFQGNPYNLDYDKLVRHGIIKIHLEDRSFNSIRKYLTENYIEGIVFWLDGEPICKIKRSDFGLEWNGKR